MMVTRRASVDASSPGRTSNDSGSFPKHSFPPDGLVAMSRIAYQNTPLSTEQIADSVFVFRGAGGQSSNSRPGADNDEASPFSAECARARSGVRFSAA